MRLEVSLISGKVRPTGSQLRAIACFWGHSTSCATLWRRKRDTYDFYSRDLDTNVAFGLGLVQWLFGADELKATI